MKFSITIPAYKRTYLQECIDSILAQTYTDFELIIVNDASPEDLDSIVNSYSDARIRYYKNEKNCGAIDVVDNWNICLSYAIGDYVMCIGDDDKLCSNCLEAFHDLIRKYPEVDILHCRSYLINDASEIIGLTPSWPERESLCANMWHRIKGLRVQFIGDFVYKTLPLKAKGGFYKLPLAWGSDDISSYMAMQNNGIVHTEQPLFCYRRSGITISNSGSSLNKIKAIKKEEEWYYSFLDKMGNINGYDEIFYNNIRQELPHYFKVKILETIAYNGISKKILKDFLYWKKMQSTTKLSNKELVYAFILAIKKHTANKT